MSSFAVALLRLTPPSCRSTSAAIWTRPGSQHRPAAAGAVCAGRRLLRLPAELPSAVARRPASGHVLERDDLFRAFDAAAGIGPIYLVGRLVRRDFRSAAFYAVASAKVVVLWGDEGSVALLPNVLLSRVRHPAVLFGLGLEPRRCLPECTREQAVLRNYFLALCLGQFLILGYNPRATVLLLIRCIRSDRLVATIAALVRHCPAPGLHRSGARGGQRVTSRARC